jgi:hypothetical protein
MTCCSRSTGGVSTDVLLGNVVAGFMLQYVLDELKPGSDHPHFVGIVVI